MYHRLYFHLVWTTDDREPSITPGVATFLCRFLRVIAQEERARILEIGIVSSHVHVLLTTHPMTEWPRLVQRLKGASSMLANQEGHADPDHPLKWAKGYTLQTVSPRAVEAVRAYLRNQPRHHPEEAIENWPGDRAEYELIR